MLQLRTRTPVLDSILTELRPQIRQGFIRAVATRSLIQGRWTDGRRGCVMAVAVMEITGRSVQQFMARGQYTDQTVATLGIPADRVIAGYQEWDRLSTDDAANFVARLKAELAATTPPAQGVLSRIVAPVPALVPA